jgi:hypothetical protein
MAQFLAPSFDEVMIILASILIIDYRLVERERERERERDKQSH